MFLLSLSAYVCAYMTRLSFYDHYGKKLDVSDLILDMWLPCNACKNLIVLVKVKGKSSLRGQRVKSKE